ncbi:Nucleoporin NUP35 [Holothuria leucospilota]|uniref:Nucleoporin NUP35 n=1 Tax=Holothuria leucospilota TaxID=206669 RepID=A0A9Q1HM48_HOLLE|nr:Nucleoporin NUP35 [Holothuria leucospilota]
MNFHGPSSPGAEPMSLGSPPQSQNLHQSLLSHPVSQSSGVLPGYLMGDPGHSPSSSRLWSSSRSPGKVIAPSSLGPKDSTSRLDRSDSILSQSRGGINPAAKDHGNAPPVAGLYDQVDSPHGLGVATHHIGTPERRQLEFPASAVTGGSLSRQTSEATPRQLQSQVSVGPPTLSRSFSHTHTPQGRSIGLMSPPSVASPAQIDPFYTQGESIVPDVELDQTWVTVFGFPPAAASYILQQFSQYGNIQKHVVASNGNWMHLQFSSKLQAKKALSKNGKIFGGNIMIGATPCIDKGVMEGGKENLYSTNLAGTPTNKRTLSITEEPDLTKRKTPIRPLTAAYQAVSSNHEVLPDHNTPQKSSTVLSKTLEYMFGW